MAVRLLGIDVPAALFARWRRYLAPEWQPFFVESDEFDAPNGAPRRLDDELRDTYKTWRVESTGSMVWLDETSFMEMPRRDRARLVRAQVQCKRGAVPTVRRWQAHFDAAALREQADGHRFVWWPSLVDKQPEAVLSDHVLDGQPASRHAEVDASTWRNSRGLVPLAKEIAGQFPASSGANCFATTMAAAGHADPNTCVVQAPFDEFLSAHCRPGGGDEEPGTVLVWRSKDGRPVHSAITIGDGWALEKPAQTWWTPRVILEVGQLIKVNRWPGQRLERHHVASRS